jgi:3-deoxy-D-manno-octulosonic acid (KDO) 8-phosphate synthase
LKIFEKIKKEFGYKVVTDIHESYQAAPAGEVMFIQHKNLLNYRQLLSKTLQKKTKKY